MESAFLAAAGRPTTKARRAGGGGSGGPSPRLTAQIGGTECAGWLPSILSSCRPLPPHFH